MNAVISSSNIKTFSSALQCLSRFSESFWLQASPPADAAAQVRLSAINSTNSAFCMFVFRDDFFLRTVVPSNDRVDCQLALKPVLGILRTRASTVERCELELTDGVEECRFSMKLHCTHGVLKTHRLTYEPKKGLLPTADPNPPHYFCIHAQTAHEWTEHFLNSSRGGEITFWCGPDFCAVKSKEDELPEARGQMRKAIHTEVRIDLNEFRDYDVAEEALLTFSLREFKATVTLAEILQVPLEISFSDGEEPLFIRLNMENVTAEFVLATSRGEKPAAAAEGENGVSGKNRPRTSTSHSGVGRSTTGAAGGTRIAGVAPSTARSTRAERSVDSPSAPSTSRLERGSPQARMPMESTPHLGDRPGAQTVSADTAAAMAPTPLFFPDGSQDSLEGDAPHRPLRDEKGLRDEAEGYDELGADDFQALDEVERAIERGEAEFVGSQLVMRASEPHRNRRGNGPPGRGWPPSQSRESFDAPRSGPMKRPGDGRDELGKVHPRHDQQGTSRITGDRMLSTANGSDGDETGNAEDDDGASSLTRDGDEGEDSDSETGSLPPGKRFRPLFG